jgi:hypothetical protein
LPASGAVNGSDVPTLALEDVGQARLVAQRLLEPHAPTPAEAVQWLTAMQVQDYTSALTSVGLRTHGRLRAEVVAALDTGDIVRSWPMRGTLHLTAAQDLSWMLRLLTPRVIRGSAARRRGLGLDEPQLERARELSIEALSGGRQLRRADLLASWDRAGLDPGGQRGVHVLRYLAMTGTLVFGPTAAGEQLIVLLDEWVPQPRDLERDQALCELAARYFRSHGPATAADLAAWSGLTAGDTRTAITLARPSLASLNIAGTEHLLDPQTPERLAAAREHAEGVLLLPGFDEFLLGYRDRSAQLDPAYADRIVPGGNGIFRPTIVSAGRVVGTWTSTSRGARQEVTATPFTNFPARVESAIAERYAALP